MQEKAQERFDDLTIALELSNQLKPSQFTVGERICIHQERGRQLALLSACKEGKLPEEITYRVPSKIEVKIQEILEWKKIWTKNNTKNE